MSCSKCVECGKSVKGSVQNVPLTYFCNTCCRRVTGKHTPLYEGVFKVSATRAREDYGCSHRDLNSIQCSYRQNPVDRAGRPMRLYLRAEAQYLGKLRREKEKQEAKLKERGAIIGKKIELEDCLGVRLSSIDAVVRKFLIMDYLDHSTNVKMTLEDIEMRFGVISKVEEILKCTPRAHPEAVFDFCVEKPDATPEDFQRERQNLNKVFRLEGARILFKVPELERLKLRETPLISDYEEFLERDSRSIISSHLQKWFCKETAEEILEHPACQTRLSFGGEEYAIAEKLYQFWNEKNDAKLRQDHLVSALKLNNLPFDAKNERLISYIEGQIDCDVEDLVGEVEIEHHLLSQNHKICLCCIAACKKVFIDCRHWLLMSHEESVQHAIEEATEHEILWDHDDAASAFGYDTDSFASYFTDELADWLLFGHEDVLLDYYY